MCLFSQLVTEHIPFLTNVYVFLAIPLSFGVAFLVGYLVEWSLISRLYKRPLDTLLATWGLSLIMQQCFRTFIGARETSATLPEWLLGSWSVSDSIDIPISGLVLLFLQLR